MISFLKAKKDLEQIIEFNNSVMELWDFEDRAIDQLNRSGEHFYIFQEKKAAIDSLASSFDGYQDSRRKVSELVLDAMRIGKKNNIPLTFTSVPPAMVGGALIPVNIFHSVVFDPSYQGVSRQMVVDTLSQTIGRCRASIDKEFYKLINPFSWIKEIFVGILRIPFMLIEATGFNVAKIEDHLIGKIFKVLELLLIVFIAYKVGFKKEDILEVIKIVK